MIVFGENRADDQQILQPSGFNSLFFRHASQIATFVVDDVQLHVPKQTLDKVFD